MSCFSAKYRPEILGLKSSVPNTEHVPELGSRKAAPVLGLAKVRYPKLYRTTYRSSGVPRPLGREPEVSTRKGGGGQNR